ncbi:MAG: hypothetical protein HZY75_12605 [Nocardioidaceae bacterium]|nr:MAG: hypothetical protein HZY75_12605 [Nocardioidaceae bacterium]
MTLTSVQRWVMSILAGSTIMHLSIGLMALAWAIDERPRQIGLWLIGTAFSFISITAALLIHQHRVLSAWLTLALIVPVAGAIVLFA